MELKNFFKEERTILIICFLVFVISAAYAFYYKISPAVDAWNYDTVAMNIINGNGFRLYPEKPLLQDDVITYQGPLYQYFLAGIFAVFGHNYEAVWIIHGILRVLSALFLFLICKLIFKENGRKTGWIAAAFFGFYPDLIEMGAMLMAETLYIFSTILIIYIFFRWYGKDSMIGIFLLGLITGLTTLIRSTGGLIFLPVFIFYFFKYRKWKQLILFLILFFLILTPWTIRNYKIYHAFIPTMANAGYNLWTGNHEGGDGEGGNVPSHFEDLAKYGAIGANNYSLRQFKNFLLDHPLTYIKFTATRSIKYFSFIRPMGFWFYQSGWSQLIFVFSSALASVFLFTFGFAGIFAAIKKEINNTFLIYLIAISFLTFLSVVPVLFETRYRLPIYPFMAIFAGFFIVRIIVFRSDYLRYLVSSFLILSFIASINIILEYGKILEKMKQIFS